MENGGHWRRSRQEGSRGGGQSMLLPHIKLDGHDRGARHALPAAVAAAAVSDASASKSKLLNRTVSCRLGERSHAPGRPPHRGRCVFDHSPLLSKSAQEMCVARAALARTGCGGRQSGPRCPNGRHRAASRGHPARCPTWLRVATDVFPRDAQRGQQLPSVASIWQPELSTEAGQIRLLLARYSGSGGFA